MLLLKKHLVELVRRGKKRQTIRLWLRPLLRAGQVSYTPGLGRMEITAVDQLESLEALTEADAVADGFESLAALRNEIRKIYGERVGERRIYRIRFVWPIDEAGRKLVIAPIPESFSRPTSFGGIATQPSHAGKSQISRTRRAPKRTTLSGKLVRKRATAMSSTQRQQLRHFILACAPKASR